MEENVYLGVARIQVQAFSAESDLMRDHYEAMDCWKCEAFLQSGINAYRWLTEAEQLLREADYQGMSDFTPELRSAVESLYNAWLKPCELADKWIADVIRRGYSIGNLVQFRDIRADVEDRLEEIEWGKLATRARENAWSDEDDE